MEILVLAIAQLLLHDSPFLVTPGLSLFHHIFKKVGLTDCLRWYGLWPFSLCYNQVVGGLFGTSASLPQYSSLQRYLIGLAKVERFVEREVG